MGAKDELKTKPVWVAWSNTDCTEGRGFLYAFAVAECEATAIRIGKGKSVQGSDCLVTEEKAIFFENKWYTPGTLIKSSTKDDDKKQKLMDAKQLAVNKAKAAGLTEDEINLLNGSYEEI